jgi:hypothetical protein
MAGSPDFLHFVFGWWSGQTGTPSEQIVVLDGSWAATDGGRFWSVSDDNTFFQAGDNRVWRAEQ